MSSLGFHFGSSFWVLQRPVYDTDCNLLALTPASCGGDASWVHCTVYAHAFAVRSGLRACVRSQPSAPQDSCGWGWWHCLTPRRIRRGRGVVLRYAEPSAVWPWAMGVTPPWPMAHAGRRMVVRLDRLSLCGSDNHALCTLYRQTGAGNSAVASELGGQGEPELLFGGAREGQNKRGAARRPAGPLFGGACMAAEEAACCAVALGARASRGQWNPTEQARENAQGVASSGHPPPRGRATA